MSVKRIILLVSMALTAVAFAAPMAAQAVVLTEGGEALEEGAEITVTSTNLQTTAGTAHFKCAKVTLHYEVEDNGPTHIALQPVPTHNATTVGCKLTTTNPHQEHLINFTETGTQTLTINEWGTGITPYTATFNVFCKLSGNVHIQGNASGTNTLQFGPSGLGGSPGCPPGAIIEGAGTLETSDGSAVFLDFVETP